MRTIQFGFVALILMLSMVNVPFVKCADPNITDWLSEDHGARIFVRFLVADELSGDVNAVPIILKFTASDDDFWSNRGDDDGDDAKFYGLDANGANFGVTPVELDYEVIDFNASSYTYIVAVNVLHLEDSDTQNFIFMYTDYDGAGDFDNPTDVWGATAKYIGHFVTNANDSSASGNNGTVSGAVLESNSSYLGGKYYLFDGSNDLISLPSGLMGGLDAFTILMQLNIDSSMPVYGTIFHNQNTSTTQRINFNWSNANSRVNGMYMADSLNTNNAIDPAWNSLENTKITVGGKWSKGTSKSYFYNGGILTQFGSVMGETIVANKIPYIGTYGTGGYLKGKIGYMWIFSDVKSDDWIKAVYNNQENYSSFVTVDSETYDEFSYFDSTNYTWDGVAGLSLHAPAIVGDIAGVQALGTHILRTDLTWSRVETVEGVYNFSTYDAYADTILAGDEELLFIICYSNPLYNSVPPGEVWPSTTRWVPTDPVEFESFKTAYGNYVYESVSHYRGEVTYFQIWNEPDGFWAPGLTRAERTEAQAIQYVELLKEGYTRAKEANPDCIILTGSLFPTDEMVNLYIPKLYSEGAKDYFDILAVNPYCSPVFVFPTTSQGTYTTCEQYQNVADIRAIMVANGDGDKDIWFTETGFLSGSVSLTTPNYSLSENNQNIRMQNLFTDVVGNLPYVTGILVYTYSDDPLVAHKWALTDSSFAKKPAYYTYQSLEKTFEWPPEATPDTFIVARGSTNWFDVKANDYGKTRFVSSVTDPEYGTAIISGGQVLYSHTSANAGTDTFVYFITSNGGEANAAVTVNIANTAPVPANDAFTVYKSTTGNVLNVTRNDTDADGDAVSITAVSTPTRGAATISGLNIIYAPPNNFTGSDTFTYTVSDGFGGWGTATVTVSITERPAAPSSGGAGGTTPTPPEIDVLGDLPQLPIPTIESIPPVAKENAAILAVVAITIVGIIIVAIRSRKPKSKTPRASLEINMGKKTKERPRASLEVKRMNAREKKKPIYERKTHEKPKKSFKWKGKAYKP